MAAVSEITQLLRAANAGNLQEAEGLLPLVYEELRRLAAAKMAQQPPGHTLQATALVHEAYLRLGGDGDRTWHDRRHYFAAAAEAMRCILVDRARRKAAIRHGGALQRVDLNDIVVATETPDDKIAQLNESLEKFEKHHAQAAELVKLRFFAGFSLAEASEILGVSERTAKRLWAYARAWLFESMQAQG
ncbi:MAG: RNA polymerase subunit sigma [Opitutaceae bacterium]|nr:RNA polymerase subunit sigma [Opitutaceae bacterium]